jgi:cyclohexanone monooxygenase
VNIEANAAPKALRNLDVIVIGAGFAGLYAHYSLRKLGLSLCGFEAASDVGGTWFWNGYPGARCDVESLDYSYSFSEELQNEWRWSERFATQPEILRYLNHVAERFDLRRDIAFETRVTSARYDQLENLWTVETNRGDTARCRFLIAATGGLSLPKTPDFQGLEDFRGKWVQTGRWPREGVDYAGKRVAVIGTGSSGMQVIPILAEHAENLTVFQRTPSYSVPARNGPTLPHHEAEVRMNYPAYRAATRHTFSGMRAPLQGEKSALEVSDEERRAAYEKAWQFGCFSLLTVYRDLLIDPAANETLCEFVRTKLRAVVKNSHVADRLTPRDYPIGAKRMVLDTNYWATFNRPNVQLVDIRTTPIERITAEGIKTTDKEYPVDVIVFATGFDAMTGSLLAMNVTGIGGLNLRDAWAQGPSSYLGLMIAGFPNFFAVTGPGSPSVLANVVSAIEHHVDWITDCLAHMQAKNLERVEAEPQAQADWVDEVRQIADMTLFPRANSWYIGANVPGKPRVFMAYPGGLNNYRERCRKIVADGYTGFRFFAGQRGSAANELEASAAG